MTTFNALLNDEAGFIVSAELVLVATICVLGLIVGLSEVALNINNELEDVGSAFTCLSQSYKAEGNCGHKGWTSGGSYWDQAEFCDGPNDIH
ncbi:MAG: branched-chain amino acid aminotransferase [Planctomycetaceae bacterium]|nr:branched-chain amino acid aminotransferase [Planctomycetaceae bacterium]MCB9951728.1 branched-chain amino acid aminotransferase [Planctomycetaceae bacterium]